MSSHLCPFIQILVYTLFNSLIKFIPKSFITFHAVMNDFFFQLAVQIHNKTEIWGHLVRWPL